MQRKHLEIAMLGIIRDHLVEARNLLQSPCDPDHIESHIGDIVIELQRRGLAKSLGNLAESFVLGDENRIGIRAIVAAYQVPSDEDKPIVIKLEADNNNLTGVQMAMLKGQAVDLTGCQGELFTAHDLGIHMAPQYELFEGAA